MRSRNNLTTNQVPFINLTPMLNVMMAILAFFVMITMLLHAEKSVDIQLPETDVADTSLPAPLVIRLNPQGQISIANKPVNAQQMNGQIVEYLQKNPKGSVILQADPKQPYAQVIQTLTEMKQAGGDRVSLAVGPT